MNHRNGFNPLSRTTAHRRAMSRNMVTSLFRYERITTTKSKALEVRNITTTKSKALEVRKSAEKLITRAKEDTVHNRREAAKFIQDEKILNKLFTEIGPRMKERNGGYTRVLKLGYRQGDAADVVILELVDYKLDAEKSEEKPAKKAEPKAKKPAAKAKDASSDAKPKKTTKKASEKKEEAPAN